MRAGNWRGIREEYLNIGFLPAEYKIKSATRPSGLVLLGFEWLTHLWFEVEFSTIEQDSNSIVFEDPEPLGG